MPFAPQRRRTEQPSGRPAVSSPGGGAPRAVPPRREGAGRGAGARAAAGAGAAEREEARCAAVPLSAVPQFSLPCAPASPLPGSRSLCCWVLSESPTINASFPLFETGCTVFNS